MEKRGDEDEDKNDNEAGAVNNLSMKSHIFLTWAAPLSLV
jgi:hypothetical protein